MRIFLDLDDTLIHSVRGGHNKNRIYRKFTGDGRYGSIARYIGYDLIQFCRMIDPDTSMLTTATRDWAEEWNAVFEFGFDSEHIYSREDYTMETSRPYSGYVVDWNGECLDVSHGVIVDNYDAYDPSPKIKMNFVFGKFCPDNWIQIREFDGRNSGDVKCVEENELDYIQKQILKKVEEI